MKKKNTKLVVHELLENPAIKRLFSFYIGTRTLNTYMQTHRKPHIKIGVIMADLLREYEEYKNVPVNELQKKLYEPALQKNPKR